MHIVAGRSHRGSLFLSGWHPWLTPIDGLTFKQPLSEGANPGRLIIHNPKTGNVDVVDLDASGLAVAREQRYSYRDTVEGTVHLNLGNALALETNHETLARDDLAGVDHLYIADLNYPWPGPFQRGYVRVLRLSHPLEDLGATPLPDVDLNDTFPFWQGFDGLALAGDRDILYVASGIQDHDDGFVAEVDTTKDQLAQVVNLTYLDRGFVVVDWYDTNRAFVTTFDSAPAGGDPALYLHLIYNGTVADTLKLKDTHESRDPRGMAFDPHHRRLYLTVGSRVMVVQVNYGADPAPILTRQLYLPLVLREP